MANKTDKRKDEIKELIEAIETIVDARMKGKKDTEDHCQRQLLLIKCRSLEHAVNGIEKEDLI